MSAPSQFFAKAVSCQAVMHPLSSIACTTCCTGCQTVCSSSDHNRLLHVRFLEANAQVLQRIQGG